MKLFELFNQSLPYEVLYSDQGVFRCSFNLSPSDVVVVDIEREDDADAWHVSFHRGRPGVMGAHSITGRGKVSHVMTTVVDIMKEFASKYKPQFITFSSDKNEDSRMKLHARMITKYAGAFGYKSVDIATHPGIPEHLRMNSANRFVLARI